MKDSQSLKKKSQKKVKKNNLFLAFFSKASRFSSSVIHNIANKKIVPILIALLIFNSLISFFVVRLFFLNLQNVTSEIQSENVKINPYPYVKPLNQDLNVSSKALVVYDPESRVVVLGKNETLRFSPASSAKIVSAIVSLEHYPKDKVLKAEGVKWVLGSKMGLEEGEEITVENLLYGMMLPSGNDAAYVLAKSYPGGIDGFVSKMNDKVKELKLKNTKFYDPSGYMDENYTTAIDLAKIASLALENEEFRKIVRTRQKQVYDFYRIIPHDLQNLNKLLENQNVIGVKTGFTEEAGGILVTSVVNKDRMFIVVVLKSLDRFYDTNEVISKVVTEIDSINY